MSESILMSDVLLILDGLKKIKQDGVEVGTYLAPCQLPLASRAIMPTNNRLSH